MRVMIVGLISLVLVACSSTPHKVSDEEVSPDWSGQSYANLLVIGVYDDRGYRVGAESSFVEELKALGVRASVSYDFMPDLSDLESNAEIAQKLVEGAYDAVLVVSTLDPGYEYDPMDYYETRGMVVLMGGQPGAATELGDFISWAGSGQYILYVGLWDASAGKPVWQITTDSSTTGSESGDRKALAEFVVQELRSKGML